ncbi:hypothetical protein PVAP13_1NG411519 [Panicum virgatum]|uniref:Uncharacterized protein n=1 Tax=Panicum virgatum TaxID=38727 RepID=A0A8T0X927_PANVG|nr:hypothetical protein PVAP13_1NG411519 [Panicum virgatum]
MEPPGETGEREMLAAGWSPRRRVGCHAGVSGASACPASLSRLTAAWSPQPLDSKFLRAVRPPTPRRKTNIPCAPTSPGTPGRPAGAHRPPPYRRPTHVDNVAKSIGNSARRSARRGQSVRLPREAAGRHRCRRAADGGAVPSQETDRVSISPTEQQNRIKMSRRRRRRRSNASFFPTPSANAL